MKKNLAVVNFVFKFCFKEKLFYIFSLLSFLFLLSINLLFSKTYQEVIFKTQKPLLSIEETALNISAMLCAFMLIFLISISFNSILLNLFSSKYTSIILTKPIGYKKYILSVFLGVIVPVSILVLCWAAATFIIIYFHTKKMLWQVFLSFLNIEAIAVISCAAFYAVFSFYKNALSSMLNIWLLLTGMYAFELKKIAGNSFLSGMLGFSLYLIPPLDKWLALSFAPFTLPDMGLIIHSLIFTAAAIAIAAVNIKRYIFIK